MSRRKLVIAIDGPAASGKSTTARLAAEALGYLHLDTGAMYRAVTLAVVREGLLPTDADSIGKLVARLRVEERQLASGRRVFLNDEDVTDLLRTPEITRTVSAVAALPVVRAAMVREQRRMGADGGVVLEGRDIGTVVFPNADLKFFLIAGIEARAQRRLRDLEAIGERPDIDRLIEEIEERDRLDSTRAASPLRQAEGSIVLDTSNLTIPEQVEVVVRAARRMETKET
ncbi:MAG: cmk [Bacteroidetes bacterium]|nr:cmk [Bacteroidota bacterium]